MEDNVRVAVAYGDGIGPEIVEATLKILRYAQAKVNFEVIDVGKIMYERGYSSGIPEEAWKAILDNKILLKGPITTPQGGGYKSLNVTLRKALGLFANIRPCKAYHPIIKTHHKHLDVVIVRENEEDLYAGIEYRQTHNSYTSIKLITRTGSEKIIRYAFEYAVKNNRKKVSCFSKDNIMKFTDGLFHQVFNEIAAEYPQIQNDHYIIDIGAARLANKPEIFDVIVTENLYGDIISDIVAETSGSVGLAGSANIGKEFAMFEAIHGSAPDIAGQNIANPSGLIQAAIMMLVHLEQGEIAAKIHNAWLKTLEEGIHTVDIYNEKISKKKVGTKEFADELIKRLGEVPSSFAKIEYKSNVESTNSKIVEVIKNNESRALVGADISIFWDGKELDEFAGKFANLVLKTNLGLKSVTCKGLQVWPNPAGNLKLVSDLWTLRLISSNKDKTCDQIEIIEILNILKANNIEFVKIENLYVYGEKLGFSLAQGE